MKRQRPVYDGIQYSNCKDFADKNGIRYDRLMYFINKKKLPFDEAAMTVLVEKLDSEKKDSNIDNQSKISDNKDDTEVVLIVNEKPMEESKSKAVKNEVTNSTSSNTSSVWAKPIYFDITSPMQIISELHKLPNIKTINLIDFENVRKERSLLDKYINKENTLNVFFYNAMYHSNDFFSTIKGSTNINLQVQIFECADQLVDHLITYYLGAIRANFPNMKFNIISKDSGFYGFIGSLCSANVKGIGIKYIEDKELRYKFSLCKYIMENTLFNHRDCIASHELGKLFANFYGKFLTNEDIEDLINSLVKFDMVSITNKGTFKWLKFNMSNIKEFYENH